MRTTHRLARLNVPAPVVDARAGGMPGDVRARVGHGRARGRRGHGPDRAADQERAGDRAGQRPAVQLPEPRRLPARGRPPVRLGGPRPAAGHPPRRAVAGRHGVAASTYPARRRPSPATATARDGGFVVRIAAADIGTGARTALTKIAAQALGTAPARVRVELGDSALPRRLARGRLDGHRVVGLGGREGVRGAAEERRARGQRGHRRRRGGRRRALPGTRSAPSSPRCAWTPAPARCACRGCSACSPPGGSSIPTLARSQFIGGHDDGTGRWR